MTITQAEIDALRRLIEEAAIPGPWHVDGLHVMAGDVWVCTGYHDGNQPGAGISPQPEYIAYANPERITRLLDAHKAQAERIETLDRDVRFLLSFVPPWAKEVPEGLGAMFYGTLTAEGRQRRDEMTAQQKLEIALMNANAPKEMIAAAMRGHYGDFTSPLAMPKMQLVIDARAVGLEDIAQRAMQGEFDD